MADSVLDREDVLNVLFYPRPEFGPITPESEITPVRISIDSDVAVGAHLHWAGEGGPLILFFHGNGEIACDYADIGSLYRGMGISFLATDYRGYGTSDGRPTSAALLDDAARVFEQVPNILSKQDLKPGPIFVMGRSIGSAAAIHIAAAAQDGIAGLILDSPFALTFELIRRLGGPIDLADADEADGFGSLDKISKVTAPTLIIHGELDRIIPIADAVALHDASAATDKRLVRIPNAGHNDLFFIGNEAYLTAIRDFVGQSNP